MSPNSCLLISVLFVAIKISFNQQNCAKYVSELRDDDIITCRASNNLCVVRSDGLKVVDACFLAIDIEDNADGGFPDGIQKNTDSSADDATLPPGSPLNLTRFHPLLGSLTGREEPLFHLGRLPRRPDVIGAKFLLFRGDRPLEPITLDYNNLTTIVDQVNRRTISVMYIVAHDFNENVNEIQYMRLKELLFDYASRRDVAHPLIKAVLLVDWSRAAVANQRTTFYRQAAVNAVLIGRELGVLSYEMTRANLVRFQDIHLIGFGLGAQVMHFAARWFTELYRTNPTGNPPANNDQLIKFGRLTALDPMATHFQGFIDGAGVVPHVTRLDATYVDVVHTSSVEDNGILGTVRFGRVGMSNQVGRIDVYVNGGLRQLGCSDEAPYQGASVPLFSNCHHRKALEYFMYSLTAPNDAPLIAYPELSWQGYVELFNAGRLRQKYQRRGTDAISHLGIQANYDDGALGLLYLHLQISCALDYIQISNLIFMNESLTIEVSPERELPQRATTGREITAFPIHDLATIAMVQLSPEESPTCGQFKLPAINGAGRINLGHPTYEGQFPWAVCIIKFTEKKTWEQVCSGSLIEPNYVITAAHCFNDLYISEKTPFYLTFGTTDCFQPKNVEFTRRVIFSLRETVFINGRYLSNSFKWDIAIIKLIDPIEEVPRDVYANETVNTLCWRSANKFDYKCAQKTYFAGFGLKSFNYVESSLTWIPTSPAGKPTQDSDVQSRNNYRYTSWSGNTFFKNLEKNEPRTLCEGDSGGPFMWYVQKEGEGQVGPNVSPFRAILVATEVAGPNCNFPEKEDGFLVSPETTTKIAFREVLRWIKNIVQYSSPLLIEPPHNVNIWSVPTFDFLEN